MAESAGKPTLHHMDNSQSQRILWLLEELGIPYTLELHYRQKSGPQKGRSPAELYDTHPMGRAPQLVTSSGRVIAESSAIAAYLITTYDTAKKFQGDSSSQQQSKNDWIRDESLTSFSGASLGPIVLMKLLVSLAVLQTPFFLRPLVRLLTGVVDKSFTGPELKTMLAYLEGEIQGQDYFMGQRPGRADFMLSFPLDMVAAWAWVSFDEYPGLKAWRERCQARDAWTKGLEKGNGYTLAFTKKG